MDVGAALKVLNRRFSYLGVGEINTGSKTPKRRVTGKFDIDSKRTSDQSSSNYRVCTRI